MAKQVVNVIVFWGYPDSRGPLGQVESCGRKLVRLDRQSPAALRPLTDTVQPCRVTHDTAPDNASRGVLFVLPTGPAVAREEYTKLSLARQALADRAKGEAAWRRAVSTTKELRSIVGGYASFNGSGLLEKSGCKFPALRVIGGKAAVWSRAYGSGGDRKLVWGECLFTLPELGEGDELSRRLIAAWYDEHSLAGAEQRLAELGLVAREIRREVRQPVDGSTYWSIRWTAEVLGERIALARASFSVPDPEGNLGDEEIPEVDAAIAAWAEGYLDRGSVEGWTTPVAGTVSVTGMVTETYEYVSPDERGTRMGGGDQFVVVSIDGRKVGNVREHLWPKAVELLGIVAGQQHAGISPRQLAALNAAYADAWTFGCLGPRGRKAMLAIAAPNKR